MSLQSPTATNAFPPPAPPAYTYHLTKQLIGDPKPIMATGDVYASVDAAHEDLSEYMKQNYPAFRLLPKPAEEGDWWRGYEGGIKKYRDWWEDEVLGRVWVERGVGEGELAWLW